MTWLAQELLPGWRIERSPRAHVAYDPRGVSEIHYREWCTPIDEPEALVRRELAELDAFTAEEIAPLEAFATDEGEDAFATSARGRCGDEPVVIDLAFVRLDFDYAVVTAVGSGHRAVVETLIRRDPQQRGVRRRRLGHLPPPGAWQREVAGLETHYFRDGAVLTVLPATPLGWPPETTAAVAESAAPGVPQRPITVASGMSGVLVHLPSVNRQVALLSDDRYLYTVRVDGADADLANALRAVLDSLAPIPPVRVPPRPGATLLGIWSD